MVTRKLCNFLCRKCHINHQHKNLIPKEIRKMGRFFCTDIKLDFVTLFPAKIFKNIRFGLKLKISITYQYYVWFYFLVCVSIITYFSKLTLGWIYIYLCPIWYIFLALCSSKEKFNIIQNVSPIHSKREKVCGFYFPVSKICGKSA